MARDSGSPKNIQIRLKNSDGSLGAIDCLDDVSAAKAVIDAIVESGGLPAMRFEHIDGSVFRTEPMANVTEMRVILSGE